MSFRTRDMARPQRGGAWKLDRGGFAEASRRLRGGFAGLRENAPSFLAKPGLKRTVLFRSSSRNLFAILSQSQNADSKHQPLEAHNTVAMKARNTLKPRSGFAKWLRLCQCYRATRSGFAGLRGTQCIAQVPSRSFWEFPTKLKSII